MITRLGDAGASPPADTRARSFAGWLVRTWPKGVPDEVRAVAAFRYRGEALEYALGIPSDTSYSITPHTLGVIG